MVIEGYVLGSPPLVGASFGMPTSSVGPRVPPSLLPLTPSHSPHSLSLLSCSPLAPLSLTLLPSLPLAPNGQTRLVVYYTIWRGPHHLCGGKGQDGSEREWGEQERSEREWERREREQEGARQGGPHHLCGGKGQDGSERERGEWERSEREQEEWEGARGARWMLY